jgi:hypothetical protein
MKITHILTENQHHTHVILRESCDGLTTEQRLVVEGIYNELSPLLEVALTADQIKNIFQTVEKDAGNRTLIGKGVDTAQQVNAALNKLGKWLQDTTPVNAFDSKFEQLKSTVGKKFPELDKKLTAMGEWAKANPGKTAAVIGVLTTLAALAGGPVGGAIAGQILRGSTELLKGEKLSTAVGRGMKAAAYGWLAGKSFELIGDAIKGGIDLAASAFDPNVKFLDMSYIGSNMDTSVFKDLKIYGREADLNKIQGVFNKATDAWSNGNYSQAEGLFNQASTMADRLNSMEYIGKLVPEIERADAIFAAGENAGTLFKGLGAAAQGAATGATGVPKKGEPAKESYYVQARPLSEGQVYLLFNRIAAQELTEAPAFLNKLGAAVKGGVKGAAGVVGDKLKQVGKNLSNKTTADKLGAAWAKAGSPTDSDAVYKFLKDQGVDPTVINNSYQSMKLPTPAAQDNTDDATDTAPAQDATADQSVATTSTAAEPASDEPTSDEPALDEPTADTTPTGKVDINTLAAEIKKAGDEVIGKVKVKLTKELKPAF